MKGVPGFNGERLRRAREAMGLSQTSLAAIVNVSKQAISQYENGADSPSHIMFDQLRMVLRHEAHFFLRPTFSGVSGTRFYRSMASATKTARLRAEARQLWVRELLYYLAEYADFPVVDFPASKTAPHLLSMDEIELLAADVRQQWGLGDLPISNLVDVVEANGGVVIRQSLESAALDALSEWLLPEDRPFIVLNSEKSVAVRSRLDLAHEVGHMILHRNMTVEQLADEEQFDLIESQAFRFGAALLLPEKPFLEDLFSVTLDGLRSLKLKWKVSIAMMIERLKDLGIADSVQHKKLRIGYNTRRWNRAEPYEDEIEIEQPTLFSKCLELLTSTGIRSIDQIASETSFSAEWLEKLLSVSPQRGVRVTPKVVEFKLRA